MDDPVSLNVKGVQDLVGSKTNKVGTGVAGTQEGEGEKIDEFTLKLDDEELIALAQEWTAKYGAYEGKIKPRQEANKTYYLGKQKMGSPNDVDDIPISSNLLFEAEETFLPAALAKNPEPVVYADNTEEGNKVSTDVKTMLQYHADVLVLRRKLALTVRHWSIYFIGILKHGWDEELNDIKTEVRNPKNFIFNPEASVDAYGDMDGYVGERITVSARKLITMFPKHSAYITIMVDGKLGTDCTYTEWWNDDYCFYTYKDKVLDKHKNPNFNYAKKEMQTDEFGLTSEVEVKGKNHFGKPKKPYTFLTVFTLGEQPHDITGLIEQNIPNQNRVSRRTMQIDHNLSRANNSDVFSANNFNEQTAKQAAGALAKGNPVIVPAGAPISEAIHRLQGQGVDASFFNELEQSKQDLRSIFGTEGISSQPQNEDTTARGMILNQQFDNSRIGGGIGDALAQVADNVFNYWVQLYYVFYTEEHYAAVMGKMKSVEYVTFSSQNLDRRLVISVAPDSMRSKDEISQMNQAMELYQAGALDPKTLLTMLNIPNPEEAAEMAVLWKIDPQTYMMLNFPEVAQQVAQVQQAQMAQQQQMQQEQANAQMEQQGAQANQQLGQKEQVHQQKLAHAEQAFQQKQALSPPPTLGKEPASSSLKNVKLPK